MNEYVCLGKVVSTHGIKGDVKVAFTCDDEDVADLFNGYLHYLDGSGVDVTYRFVHKGMVVIHVDGVDTINDALLLKGKKFYISQAEMPDTDSSDEFYYYELIGLDAICSDSRQCLGQIMSITQHCGQDCLEIQYSDSSNFLIVPFTKERAPEINTDKGFVVVVDPQSLSLEGDKGISIGSE